MFGPTRGCGQALARTLIGLPAPVNVNVASNRVALGAVVVLFGAAVLVGLGLTLIDPGALPGLSASGGSGVPTERVSVEQSAATASPTRAQTATAEPTSAATTSPTQSPTPTATRTQTRSPTLTATPTPTATPVQNSDLDRLNDSRERELGTDPDDWDTDGDRLGDYKEVQVGTDPLNPDTDGDRLRDGWEVRKGIRFQNGSNVTLSGADPLHKDFYVVYSSSKTVDPIRDYERKDIQQFFAAMPVTNPDGEEGITVHDVTAPGENGKIDQNLIVDSAEDYDTLENTSVRNQLLGNRRYIYHHVMLVNIKEDRTGWVGRAQSTGWFSLVDGRFTEGYGGSSSIRTNIVVHELLHNIQGRRGPTAETGHTEGGWLSTGEKPASDEEYLSESVADYLGENGFATLRD